MKNLDCFFPFLIIAFAFCHSVKPQNQSGFISLICGLVPKDLTYVEKKTNITYKSDSDYIDSGVTGMINETLRTEFPQQFWNLRSFPEGQRNCYNFNLTKNQRYLIRATFVYGNYDGLNQLPAFDLYIGLNKWTSISTLDVWDVSTHEIIHVSTQDRLQVCLVKTGETTPFISSLEIRPLDNDTYVTQNGSLMLFTRIYFPPTRSIIRYEEDVHDRIWLPYIGGVTSISTDLPVNTSTNSYDVPQSVAKTAMIPEITSQPLNVTWTFDNITAQSYIYMHFAEIQDLGADEIREFNITYNGGLPWFSFFRPSKLSLTTIYSRRAVSSPDGKFNFTFTMTDNSTLPPLVNGIEIYEVLDF